jgi:hypothetical protein
MKDQERFQRQYENVNAQKRELNEQETHEIGGGGSSPVKLLFGKVWARFYQGKDDSKGNAVCGTRG